MCNDKRFNTSRVKNILCRNTLNKERLQNKPYQIKFKSATTLRSYLRVKHTCYLSTFTADRQSLILTTQTVTGLEILSSPVLSNKMKWLWSSILTQLCIISAAAEKPALYLSVCQPEQFVFGWIALGDSFMESRPKLAALPAKNKSLILTIMRDTGKEWKQKQGKRKRGKEREESIKRSYCGNHCKGINYFVSVSKDLPLVMLNTDTQRDVR